jgi:hypothetical protein
MTTTKAKAGYMAVGALLTVFILYPKLKETMSEQKQGLFLSPEEVRLKCGKPQTEDTWGFLPTYVDGDRRMELQFMTVNHRMFLHRVKWSTSKGGGEINTVSKNMISDYVKRGWLPSCLEDAAR